MKQENDSNIEENFVAGDNSQLQFLSAVRGFEIAKTDEEVNNIIKQIQRLAKKGNAEAQYFIGRLYYDGDIYEQDYKKAIAWFLQSAQLQNTDALFMLGVMYCKGWGIDKDEEEAFRHFMLAADEGDAYAQFNVGIHYYNG